MIFITEMPSTPETGNCEKHGQFDFLYTQRFGGKIWVRDCCGICATEIEAKRKLDEENEKVARDKEREEKHQESLRVNAGISKRNSYKTFDDYKCTNEGQTKAKADCERYFKNFPSDQSMIMVGGVGTGKTLLASIGIESIINNYRCEIIKTIDAVRELKATWAKDSKTTEERLISYYRKLDLLVLDEVGSQFGSDTEKLFIFDIIDGRYQDMKPTILISNLDIDGIKEVIGERCVDRLREGGGMMIAFDWESSRK
jgi:DNA replication protein DnaC